MLQLKVALRIKNLHRSLMLLLSLWMLVNKFLRPSRVARSITTIELVGTTFASSSRIGHQQRSRLLLVEVLLWDTCLVVAANKIRSPEILMKCLLLVCAVK